MERIGGDVETVSVRWETLSVCQWKAMAPRGLGESVAQGARHTHPVSGHVNERTSGVFHLNVGNRAVNRVVT
jgi:hypothetical protein